MAERTSTEWLQQSLHTLMMSPYIHFTPPKIGRVHAPGPIDLFSTRFNNMFSRECTGVVAGREVDRDGLKQALLALQREWRDEAASFAPSATVKPGHYACRADFIPKGREQMEEVRADASFMEERGEQRIHHLSLDGDASLFVTSH
ncbi:uncharacterized protein LAESUDRAFT_730612 [Laetiporus sulphureus 93-53]|uniref:Uncharacterized protein n=1 Tax=Laetiporus sulphureus 93-53 TaxID=1314785 RepID=A0A165C2R4_9APHY|nr:uncharacterized protein LAESUDRAFT_730612 [Laetiporus sulphureus 93-53]KZT02096.1 hypothetical protein LAESUDRAFT_730612 [Laetiporus sulphureus 93-53]